MTTDIKYQGISAVPSDYDCPDGSLDIALNICPDASGALAPLSKPVPVGLNISGSKFELIHTVDAVQYYILRSGNTLSFTVRQPDGSFHEPVSLPALPLGGDDTICGSCSVIGKTIAVPTSRGIFYYLFKDASTHCPYILLGSKIPRIPVSFGLDAEMVAIEKDIEDICGYERNNGYNLHSWVVSDPVLGTANRLISQIHSSRRFVMPFFVRCALRLYDGTVINQSVPVYMPTDTGVTPRAYITHVDNTNNGETSSGNDLIKDMHISVAALACTLNYSPLANLNDIGDWSDIVKSLDIFVSPPIYYYNPSGVVSSADNPHVSGAAPSRNTSYDSITAGYTVSRLSNACGNAAFAGEYAQSCPVHKLYGAAFAPYFRDPNNISHEFTAIAMPHCGVTAYREKISSASSFHLVASIPLASIKIGRHAVPVKDGVIDTILQQETIPDAPPYASDTLVGSSLFAYNNRLHLSGCSHILNCAIHPGEILPFTNGYCTFPSAPGSAGHSCQVTTSFSVAVKIKKNNREIWLRSDKTYQAAIDPYNDHDGAIPLTHLIHFFYPDPDALSIAIVSQDRSVSFDLSRHDFLHGASLYEPHPDNHLFEDFVPTAETDVSKLTVSHPSSIYVSEVNNPFLFTSSGVVTVGSGTVLALSSAARALSQGQFGQFPLYAFTTEGVWALELSGTGSYAARQPITRDVCTDPSAIAQLDSAVLFPSARGLMLLTGSETSCFSETLDDSTPFDISTLPASSRLLDFAGILSDATTVVPMRQFIDGCGILYDYPGQRIIIFNPLKDYAYVYSTRSRLWGMMTSDIKGAIKSYPDALAVDSEGNVVNFSQPGETFTSSLLVTRPIKLDAPDLLKTVNSVIQRGCFRKGAVKSVLYGSRDLIHWHLVASSVDHFLRGFSGSPYKYFRIAIVATLDRGESISGASFDFNPRLANRLR